MEEHVKDTEHRSLGRVLATIGIVSSCLWGALFAGWYWHQRQHERRLQDERFLLRRIAARSTTQDRLPLGVLTEMLNLDRDTKASIFELHPKEVRTKLLSCNACTRAKVWRLLPETLGIEYTLRTPVATIAGLKNVGVDALGVPFFLFPYYAPKKLPALVVPLERYSSLSDLSRRLRGIKETAIALRLLELIIPMADHHNLAVDVLDISRLRQQNVFRREVIIAFSSPRTRDCRLYIRIHFKELLERISLLPTLFHALLGSGFRAGIIDLRYEGIAILSGEIAQQGAHP